MEAGSATAWRSGPTAATATRHDIVKLHCLGANRVGFGTLAMVSLGCTICRGCQLDTCHVGIATQIESEQDAQLKGLKKFTPQDYEAAADNCARFFGAMGEEVERAHGLARLRALPGPGRPLRPARPVARGRLVDLHELIRPVEPRLDLEPLDMPAPPRSARPRAWSWRDRCAMASSDRERVLGTAAARGAGARAHPRRGPGRAGRPAARDRGRPGSRGVQRGRGGDHRRGRCPGRRRRRRCSGARWP